MNQHSRMVRSVVIVGGGTAGWMAASALARAFAEPGSDQPMQITVVESETIGTVGVGEATIPPIRKFIETIGLDESDFMAATGATIKLGIAFQNWSAPNSRYFHGFGDHGPAVRGQPYRQHLFRLKNEGRIETLEPWSVPGVMARQGRFAPPVQDPRSILSAYSYAFHFDAGLFAQRLRSLAEAAGVVRIEGRIVDVEAGDGRVDAIRLDDGRRLDADLFIDCSGFRGLLIEGALKAGYEDWTRWLPCDRAIALPCAAAAPPVPFTTATAMTAGWRWRIPLQHRVGNGYVYSSAFIDDQTALEELLQGVEAPPAAEPNRLRFVTGRRRSAWMGNVVSLGLASGFLEPLESTSINLIQTGIGRLLELFPDRDFDPVLIAEYNRRTAQEFERIRDFIIAHYHLAGRTEGELWRHCRETPPPDTLAAKLDLFRARGEVALLEDESFREDSWAAVLTGLGVWPKRVSPLVERLELSRVEAQAGRLAELIGKAVASLPDHRDYLTARSAASMEPAA
ncbi:tryptophan halogenase family protein [Brevundimonas sp.]|uniref:tryptophan halogenase family protein n=1 Tax=Brevundimonas sp. TaxID=1871086 RepID=UPI00261B86A5|nr:tryptophan halogenase family protein [Brevundimonas sp.]